LDNPLLKLEAITTLFQPAQFTTICELDSKRFIFASLNMLSSYLAAKAYCWVIQELFHQHLDFIQHKIVA
jgi:hypothetical protein